MWIKKFSAPLTVNEALLKDEQAIDGWFQFDYVLDLAKGTENQYIVIG